MKKDKEKTTQASTSDPARNVCSESLSGLIVEIRESQEIIKKLDNEQRPTGVFGTIWNKWLSTSTS